MHFADGGKVMKFVGIALVGLLIMKFSWDLVAEPMLAKNEAYAGTVERKESKTDLLNVVRIFSSGDFDSKMAKRLYRRNRFTKYLIWVDCEDGRSKKVQVNRYFWEKAAIGDPVLKEPGERWPKIVDEND